MDMDVNGSAWTTQGPCDPGIPDRYTWQQMFLTFNPLPLYVDRYVTPIWYVIGITGNTLAARIWLDKRIRVNNSSAIYLATLSVVDLFFLLFHILQELKYAWGVNTLNFPVICESYFTFSIIAQYLSPILVLAFTCERWIAVCHPFAKEKFCTSRRAVIVVAVLFFVSSILGAMQSFFWTYDQESDDCTMRKEVHKGGEASLFSIWTWCTEMLVFLAVPLVIFIFNILVIKEINALNKAGKNMMPTAMNNGKHTGSVHTSAATTVMLLSVSFYVIVTTLPATIVYAIYSKFSEGPSCLTDEEIRTDFRWNRFFTYMTYRKFVEEICLSHYACNFFLYVFTGPQFRKTLVRLLSIPRCSKQDDKIKSENTQRSSLRNAYIAVTQDTPGKPQEPTHPT